MFAWLKTVRLRRHLSRLLDGRAQERPAAIRALAKLGDTRAIEQLILTLADPCPSTRREAALALAHLGEPAWQGVIQGDDDDFERLGTSGDVRAFEPLLRILEIRDSPSPEIAARALGNLGDARAVGPLIRLLVHGSLFAQGAAIAALGKIGGRRAVGTLMSRLKDPNLHTQAMLALADTGEMEPLLGLMRDPSWSALTALVRTHDAKARALIEGAIGDGPNCLQARTALHVAVSCDDEVLTASILDRYGDVWDHASPGDTLLHEAAAHGGVKVVKLLLDRGIEVNARNQNAVTPLHRAAWEGRIEVVDLLLERGADGKARDAAGRTPYQCTRHTDLQKVVGRLLADRGFGPDMPPQRSYCSECGCAIVAVPEAAFRCPSCGTEFTDWLPPSYWISQWTQGEYGRDEHARRYSHALLLEGEEAQAAAMYLSSILWHWEAAYRGGATDVMEEDVRKIQDARDRILRIGGNDLWVRVVNAMPPHLIHVIE